MDPFTPSSLTIHSHSVIEGGRKIGVKQAYRAIPIRRKETVSIGPLWRPQNIWDFTFLASVPVTQFINPYFRHILVSSPPPSVRTSFMDGPKRRERIYKHQT